MKPKTKVMFVCRANRNRSPTARSIFRGMLKERGLEKDFELYDAGTENFEYGTEFNPRIARGFHHIIVMDKDVEEAVRTELPDFKGTLRNFKIPDEYVRDAPELKRLLRGKLKTFLKELGK